MGKIRSFMEGRYGFDRLGICIILLGGILNLGLSFAPLPYLRLIGYIPFAIEVFRVLSRNTEKRKRENERFLKIWLPWKNFFIKKSRQHQDTMHKYYACPSCGRTLRVPKGRGKIEITCPHCSRKFKRNTGKC